MSLYCPQCHSLQQIDADTEETSFFCQNCGGEFNSTDHAEATENRGDDSEQSDDTDAPVCDVSEHGDMPPQRESVHIWPWFLVMLIIMIGSGFFAQKEKWLDNRWLRSTATNLGLPLEKRDKDWLVLAESIQPEWIIRADNSKALIIRGRLKNLLASDLLPPMIEITFYAASEPARILGTQQLPVTMRPDALSIKQVPFVRPAIDSMPISPLSQREFTLIIESLPDGTGDFTLLPKAN